MQLFSLAEQPLSLARGCDPRPHQSDEAPDPGYDFGSLFGDAVAGFDSVLLAEELSDFVSDFDSDFESDLPFSDLASDPVSGFESDFAPAPVAPARACGPSPLPAVVIYGNARKERVASIELSLRGSTADQLAVLSAMSSIPSPEPLLIVDWERGTYARIGDAEEMQRFTASPALA